MKPISPHYRRTTGKPRTYGIESPLHAVQIAAYRRMTPWQKLEAVAEMHRSARRLLATGLRMRHPEWTPQQIEHEVRDRMLHGVS